ncbi:MAG: hypothetical protein H6R19_990 [Proteobacteria bacterium]|nr:hypothetical protein [Pseudomonadota bacterium]
MFDIAIYSKTSKGRAEVTERTLGLTPRLRRALIMVDGKTSFGVLRQMLQKIGDADPTEIMRQLKQLDLVESDYDLPPMPEFPGMMLDDPSGIQDFQPTR